MSEITPQEHSLIIAAVALDHGSIGVARLALLSHMCPCCRAPTLSARGMYDICLLCNWEDDGQDDHNADVHTLGPNHMSLTEGRMRWGLEQARLGLVLLKKLEEFS